MNTDRAEKRAAKIFMICHAARLLPRSGLQDPENSLLILNIQTSQERQRIAADGSEASNPKHRTRNSFGVPDGTK
jgi:hypothetical protein